MDFLRDLFDVEMLKDEGITLAGGAVGGGAFLEIVKRAKTSSGAIFNTPLKRGAFALGFGWLGASLLWNRQRSLAMGHLGAMGAFVAMDGLALVMDEPSVLDVGLRSRTVTQTAIDATEAAAAAANVNGFRLGRPALAATTVTPEFPSAGLGGLQVRRDNVLVSALAGAGAM